MTIRLFESMIKAATSVFSSNSYSLEAPFVTLSRQGYNKYAMDVAPRFLTEVTTGALDNPLPTGVNTKRILKITAHGFTEGEVISFSSGPNDGVEIGIAKVLSADYVLLAGELPLAPTASNAYSRMRYVSQIVSASGAVTATITNPDATQAQFNFSQQLLGTRTDTGGLTAVDTTVATLTFTLRKLMVKNDSGVDLICTIGARPGIVIPKGSGLTEFDAYGITTETVKLKTFAGSGEAGNYVYMNYLG